MNWVLAPAVRRRIRRWRQLSAGSASHNDADTLQLPGLPGRVHRNDSMLPGGSSEEQAIYARIGRSGFQLVENALALVDQRPSEVKRLLDFGCGYGRVLRAIVQHVDATKIDAFDVDSAAVRFCATEFGVNGLTFGQPWDFSSVPFSRYDCVWAGSVMTHLSAGFTRETFGLLTSILAPNGVLIFTTHGDEALARAENGFFGPRYGTVEASHVRAEYEATGFCFVPYESSDFAALPFTFERSGDFGMTWMSSSFVEGLISDVGASFRLLRLIPSGWEGVQDAVIVQRVATDRRKRWRRG